jgi:hypothetical protein
MFLDALLKRPELQFHFFDEVVVALDALDE